MNSFQWRLNGQLAIVAPAPMSEDRTSACGALSTPFVGL